jgi:hypothetical protein
MSYTVPSRNYLCMYRTSSRVEVHRVAPRKVAAKGQHVSTRSVVSANDKEKNVCAGKKKRRLFVLGSHM